MKFIFIFIVLAYFAGNIYIYIRGLQALGGCPVWVKWTFSVLFWFCASAIILIHLLRNTKIPIPLLNFTYEIGTGWLVFTLYMVLFLIAFDCLRIFNIAFRHQFIVSMILTCCVLAYGYFRFQRPTTQAVNIHIDKLLTTPPPALKVVGISDLHLGLRTTKSRLSTYVEMINGQNPDLIIISGDLIDNGIEPVKRQHLMEELALLKAPMGIYMVPGNHEYISGISECMEYIEHTPIHFLRDSVVVLPNGIQIVGRDDLINPSRKPLSELIKQANPNLPIIVLDHQPYELAQAADAGADLLFCGHTHRGQVWPMSWLTDHMFEVSHGSKIKGKTNVYVSSGLALWGAPFRIGTESELVVFNLTFDN